MPVAAIVGGALAAGGSILAASKNSKAIKQSTAAQTASNADSLALQQNIYNQNKGALAPFMERGNAAGGALNALLGLGGTGGGTPALPENTGQFTGMPWNEFQQATDGWGYEDFREETDALRSRNARGLIFEGRDGVLGGYGGPGPYAVGGGIGGGVSQGQAQSPQQAAANAYEIFKQSTGYQTRFNEGLRAMGATFAGRGMSQSGAAIKSALRYGQDYGSNEFGKYISYLSNQQGVGLSGASALAGVGQNYANNVTDLNTQNANFLGQAAVARANNTNSMIGGVLGGISQAAGGFSSYR